MGEKRPYVDKAACTGCGACVDICFAEPPVFDLDGVSTVTGPERCYGCSACVMHCPAQAIVVR